jgi:SPP1 gp7 family putative phage head morphogenesis protein
MDAIVFLTRAYLRCAARFIKAVGAIVLPRVADYGRPVVKTDAKDPGPLMGKARAAGIAAIKGGVDVSAAKVAAKVDKASKHDLGRLGISLEKDEKLGPMIGKFRKENVALITNMADEELGKVEKILATGGSRHPRSIAKDIESQLGVSKSRATLIARDQVTKLHAKITKHRHKAAGIKGYVWTTSNDERVRPEHEELDGEEFEYDDPDGGDEGDEPGIPVNCRCVAFPVKPGAED